MGKEEGAAMEQLVRRIAEEVLRRMHEAQPRDEDVQGTLALMTTHVASPKSAQAALVKRYGKEISGVTFGEAYTAPGMHSARYEDIGADEVLSRAAGSANIVLVTPKIILLERIAAGNDEGFVEHVVTRSLLWGRDVSVLLDFEAPRFKRNTFYEKLCDVLGVLREMGMHTLGYRVSGEKGREGLSLVTEREVVEAYTAGREIVCEAGAIVTPSAKDKARELDVAIN
ncbi:MAG: hypothetical protein VB081_04810 [Christensenella sp.]|uniref:hypothetical protein n=1 Tax=Christensenella sp. TaxID=1935934 RepID=UPI002B1F77AD|nr:hypothetical protein [Christensenella sp.]MEA5002800.1 hypothetical protein [Christensenella sp.]